MIKAIVQCSDGLCYPCYFIDWINDYSNLLPMAFIRFVGDRPDYVRRDIVVNMLSLRFGGYDEQRSEIVLSTSQHINS